MNEWRSKRILRLWKERSERTTQRGPQPAEGVRSHPNRVKTSCSGRQKGKVN